MHRGSVSWPVIRYAGATTSVKMCALMYENDKKMYHTHSRADRHTGVSSWVSGWRGHETAYAHKNDKGVITEPPLHGKKRKRNVRQVSVKCSICAPTRSYQFHLASLPLPQQPQYPASPHKLTRRCTYCNLEFSHFKKLGKMLSSHPRK